MFFDEFTRLQKQSLNNNKMCVRIIKQQRCGPLAQLGERLGDNQKVTSSSLVWATSKPLKHKRFRGFYLLKTQPPNMQ